MGNLNLNFEFFGQLRGILPYSVYSYLTISLKMYVLHNTKQNISLVLPGRGELATWYPVSSMHLLLLSVRSSACSTYLMKVPYVLSPAHVRSPKISVTHDNSPMPEKSCGRSPVSTASRDWLLVPWTSRDGMHTNCISPAVLPHFHSTWI